MELETLIDVEEDSTDLVGDSPVGDSPHGDLVDDELLVEEISIDGMCGVY